MSLFLKILNNNLYKTLELILLSSILPYVVLVLKLYNFVLPVLWIVSVYCLLVYYMDKQNIRFKLKSVFNLNLQVLLNIIIRWLILSFILFLITYYFFNDKLFIIQKNNPEILWKIMILYPIFSALPQEFIFCKFFFIDIKVFLKAKQD